MTQEYTYHCHTNFSDGKNTAEEMINQAKKLNFSHIGISDHLIVHKNIEQSPSWSMMKNKTDCHIYRKDFKTALPVYQKHCEELRECSRKHNFKIYIGFEVDFFTYDGWLEELKEFLSSLDYDYVISGNHFLFDEKCETIYNIHKNMIEIEKKEVIKKLISSHFKTIEKSAKSGLFKFIAHLDYVRKMGDILYSVDEYKTEKMAVIKSLKDSGTGTEISTKGLRKVGDFYPDEFFLQNIKFFNLPVVISDDAHCISELGGDFYKAEERLSELGIKNRINFENLK